MRSEAKKQSAPHPPFNLSQERVCGVTQCMSVNNHENAKCGSSVDLGVGECANTEYRCQED